MFLSHNAVVTANSSGRLLCIMFTKTVCMAGDDQGCEKAGPHNQKPGFLILTLQQKCLLLQQGCSPELVSMQYAWYHDCRGVQKESLRFPMLQCMIDCVVSSYLGFRDLIRSIVLIRTASLPYLLAGKVG